MNGHNIPTAFQVERESKEAMRTRVVIGPEDATDPLRPRIDGVFETVFATVLMQEGKGRRALSMLSGRPVDLLQIWAEVGKSLFAKVRQAYPGMAGASIMAGTLASVLDGRAGDEVGKECATCEDRETCSQAKDETCK